VPGARNNDALHSGVEATVHGVEATVHGVEAMVHGVFHEVEATGSFFVRGIFLGSMGTPQPRLLRHIGMLVER
jgi:hypothetical protein